jgi:hypothetical protein
VSLTFLTRFGRLYTILDLKYKLVLNEATQKISYRNQYYKAINKASQDIKCTLIKPVFSKLKQLTKYSHPSQIIIYPPKEDNFPTKAKFLFKVLQAL